MRDAHRSQDWAGRKMTRKVVLIRGDGIGPEVIASAVRVIDAALAQQGHAVDWLEADAGQAAMARYGTPLPQITLEAIKKHGVALKGPITTPIGTGFRSVNVALRQELGLYANVRPCRYFPGARSLLRRPEFVELIVVRENTEDLYAGIEFERGSKAAVELISRMSELTGKAIRPDSGLSIKPISEFASERIARFAFELARSQRKRKVTSVSKANIMKHTDGLFKAVVERVASGYPDIAHEHLMVDNMAMQLVTKPERYDVLLLPNLYGDIISDLCAGLIGGLGLAPSANIGESAAIFEPAHGSAPKYAGLNKVNPSAAILSGVMMLRALGWSRAAEHIEAALAAVIKENLSVTFDLKPRPDDPTAVGTSQMTEAVLAELRRSA